MIAWLAHVALSNAILVIGLAYVVALVARYFRRPAVTHTLWVLVLVKLITPPLIWVPVPVKVMEDSVIDVVESQQVAGHKAGIVEPDVVGLSGSLESQAVATRGLADGLTSWTEGVEAAPAAGENPSVVPAILLPARFLNALRNEWALRIWQICIVIWVTGTLWVAATNARKLLKFSRLVALLGETCEGQCETVRVGQILGLKRVPKLVFLNAPCTPMLWGVGPWLRVIFPKVLWDQLSAEERATLVAHELAHYARGDHYVRILELLTGALFWWHPVVTWACREIEIAEEDCCDSWVIDGIRGEPLTYARALLTTLDYISTHPVLVPPTQTGVTQVPFVEYRLKQIMYRTGNRSHSRSGAAVAGLIAAMWMPIAPFVHLQPRTAESAVISQTADRLPAAPFQGDLTQSIAAVSEAGSIQSEPDLRSPDSSSVQEPAPPSDRVQEYNWGIVVSPGGQFRLRAAPGRRAWLENRRTRKQFNLSSTDISCACFTPDGRQLLTGSTNGSLQIWNCETGRSEKILSSHHDEMTSLAVDRSGQRAVSAGREGSVVIWDLVSGRVLHAWRAEQPVVAVRFTQSGTRLVLATSVAELKPVGQVMLVDGSSLELITSLAIPQEIAAIEPTGESETLLVSSTGVVSGCDFLSGDTQLRGSVPQSIVPSAVFSQHTTLYDRVDDIKAGLELQPQVDAGPVDLSPAL